MPGTCTGHLHHSRNRIQESFQQSLCGERSYSLECPYFGRNSVGLEAQSGFRGFGLVCGNRLDPVSEVIWCRTFEKRLASCG